MRSITAENEIISDVRLRATTATAAATSVTSDSACARTRPVTKPGRVRARVAEHRALAAGRPGGARTSAPSAITATMSADLPASRAAARPRAPGRENASAGSSRATSAMPVLSARPGTQVQQVQQVRGPGDENGGGDPGHDPGPRGPRALRLAVQQRAGGPQRHHRDDDELDETRS